MQEFELLRNALKRKNKRITPEEYFIGKNVYCDYNRKTFDIEGVALDLDMNSQFPNPKYKTFQDYYEKCYNIKFNYKDSFLVYRTYNGLTAYYPPSLLYKTGLTSK